MKRTALLFGALVLAVASRAQAQLTMQMTNGWSFTFAGNINAFAVYEHNSKNGTTNNTPAAIVAPGDLTGFRVRTGLLPAFAVFEAKGKEGNTDLSVHFGFAPQIQSPHDNFGNGTQAGAQIDMRQLFLTVGGSWGQILAGRELGVFQRQNILNDQTLFGIGATGGNGAGANGTTLGRIGYGYIYPNFVAQMTYSTVGGKPGQLSISLSDPSPLGGVWTVNKVPRIEAEGTWKSGKLLLWVNGTVQNSSTAKNAAGADSSKTATGGGAGFRWGDKNFSVVGSGYYAKGVGTTVQFANGIGTNQGTRKSYGYIGQVTFTPSNSKVTVAGSYGASLMKNATNESRFKVENALFSGGVYYQATKSLKVVGEFNYTTAKDKDPNVGPLPLPYQVAPKKNSSIAPAFGLMLFF